MVFDGEEIKLLIAKDLNLLREILSDGGNEQIFGCWVGFLPSPGSPVKVQEKVGKQSTPEGCNIFLTFLVRMEIPDI